MSPRFVLGRENVPCVAEVVNRSLKADCTHYNLNFVSKNEVIGRCNINEGPDSPSKMIKKLGVNRLN